MLAQHWGGWQDDLGSHGCVRDNCEMILRIPGDSNSQRQRVEQCIPGTGVGSGEDGEMLIKGLQGAVMWDESIWRSKVQE